MPKGFCICCGAALQPNPPAPEPSGPPELATTRPLDVWFHDVCPIERNMQQWRHCPACGSDLEHSVVVRCPHCDMDLPKMYQYCLRNR